MDSQIIFLCRGTILIFIGITHYFKIQIPDIQLYHGSKSKCNNKTLSFLSLLLLVVVVVVSSSIIIIIIINSIIIIINGT